MKCAVLQIITIMCHTCAREFLNLSFNKAVTDKISNFQDIAPNFTFSQIL